MIEIRQLRQFARRHVLSADPTAYSGRLGPAFSFHGKRGRVESAIGRHNLGKVIRTNESPHLSIVGNRINSQKSNMDHRSPNLMQNSTCRSISRTCPDGLVFTSDVLLIELCSLYDKMAARGRWPRILPFLLINVTTVIDMKVGLPPQFGRYARLICKHWQENIFMLHLSTGIAI